jgi:Tfp pilus assembly protein PilN
MARILGLEIDGDMVRGALINVALRSTLLERYVEARVLPADAVPFANGHGPLATVPAALQPNLLPGMAPEPPTDADGEPLAEVLEPVAPLSPLAIAVRNVIAQCGRPPDGIHVHLDGRRVSLRPLTLPAGAAKRLNDILPGELENLLPFPVSEAIIHHQPVSTEELSLTVMTAAVRREHVAAALASFAVAGIEPRQLAAGAASLDGLVPLLAVLQTSASVMLVDLGDETTDVCIIKDGRTALARTISVGMGSIRGGEPGAADELAGSLRRTVASYRMKGGTALDRVVVGGEGSSEPATRDWLSGVLGCSAETVALPAGDGMILEHELPRFMRVAALAGRAAAKGQRINLRQGEFVSRHAAGEIRHYARLLSIAAAAILASFAISLYTRYTVLDTERAELRAELSAMTHSMFRQRTEDPAQARRLVVGGAGERDPMPRMGAYHVMGAIAELIPEDAEHTTRRLTIEFDDEARNGELEIQGTVSSVTQRDAIAAALEAHECFSEVTPGATSSRNEILSYRIEAEIRCPGDQPEPEAASGAAGRRNSGTP